MRKLRLGIVGLGRLGFIHAGNIAYRLKHASLEAVCSIRPEELEQARQTLSIEDDHCYQDYQAMIDDALLDAVVIASSSDQHCPQLISALQAGLHVFCEKPLGTTVAACEEAEAAARQYKDATVMLGFMRRYDLSYQYAKEKIDSGYIGRPILFRSYSVDPAAAMPDFLKYLPSSAGQFLDMAVHDIDLARWMLNSEPRTIFATGASYAYPEFDQYHDGDNVAALMQFENDAMAFILAGRTAPHGYNVETEIIGTKATLRISSVPQKNLVEILDASGVRQECFQNFAERFNQAFETELQEFVNCILENRSPGITLADGTRATQIALQATQSFRQRELIKC